MGRWLEVGPPIHRSLCLPHQKWEAAFQPQSGDRVAISGAGDGHIEVRELETEDVTHICTCHEKRVKRIATVPTQPNHFYSASEDGTVIGVDSVLWNAAWMNGNKDLQLLAGTERC
ncbi:WD and tetratricopeptide repeats protein 1 [Portunus trituberculatus]|uniref:WD and tetratricopeptide repeats protein 1 n=1 Tax=Portunus trituberculatus TaxID=210409 RepID=A0A5B7FR74_PORTR|nr:WD and tetratricopeptide repeats protein 1 [Portunus trituberculatus]